MTVIERFQVLNCDDVVQFADKSKLYALQRNHSLNVTTVEIRGYIAIFVLNGYLTPEYMTMFWEGKRDSHIELIVSSIRRNKFSNIFRQDIVTNQRYRCPKYFTELNRNFTANFDKNSYDTWSHKWAYELQWFWNLILDYHKKWNRTTCTFIILSLVYHY